MNANASNGYKYKFTDFCDVTTFADIGIIRMDS